MKEELFQDLLTSIKQMAKMKSVGQVTDASWYEAMNKVMNINLKPRDYTYPGNILITYQKDLSKHVYLDELEGQEELRKEYFAKRWNLKNSALKRIA